MPVAGHCQGFGGIFYKRFIPLKTTTYVFYQTINLKKTQKKVTLF
jgi:hypothetical protein